MTWGGAEAGMLALGSDCKYRSSLAERFNCSETVINQLLADSYQNPISEWQVTNCIWWQVYSDKWVGIFQLYSCIWWQALSQNLTLISVPAWPSYYFIYHLSLCLFTALSTCLSWVHMLTLVCGELCNYFTVSWNIIIEIKRTINVMHLNHPETISYPWSGEKLPSMKPVPGAKKVGDHWSRM